jgi:hypothetical protein
MKVCGAMSIVFKEQSDSGAGGAPVAPRPCKVGALHALHTRGPKDFAQRMLDCGTLSNIAAFTGSRH